MVTVYKTVSALFDMIHYCSIYFNREEWLVHYKPYANPDHNILEYYNEFNNDNPSLYPPENLFPFFYFSNESISPMKAYCQRNLNEENYTLLQIIENLSNFNIVKKSIISFILEPYQQDIDIKAIIKEDNESIEKALNIIKIKKKHKQYYKMLFTDFNDIVKDLISYMEKIIPEMLLFHESKSYLIPNILKKFKSDENLNIIKKIYNLDDDFNFDAQPFLFCFINRYIKSVSSYNSFTNFVFCLGSDFNPYTYHDIDYYHVNYSSIITLFKNPDNNLILDHLIDGEATVTELTESLHISRTRIIKAIKNLHDELAIIVEYLYGKGIYYIINPEYWYHVKNIIEDRFNKILNNTKNISILYINDIDYEMLIKMLANSDINEIIDCIAKGVNTLSTISQKLYIPNAKIKNIINYLLHESIILITKRDIKGIHYQINPAYWISVKSILDVKINKILSKFKGHYYEQK